LTVTGKGKGLKEQEIVSLKFRRLANRMNWEEGSLMTGPVDDEAGRVAYVEKNAFVHHERFATAGEVEVRIGLAHPDGAPSEDRQIRRVFRVASLPEEANAIGSAAKKIDAAIRGLRLMLDDLEAMRNESCPPARKQAHLQKRIDWRRNAYRQEIADCFLTASAHALGSLMTDIENAIDLERAGKDTSTMMSSLSGKPFSWEAARVQLGQIEAVSLRERALLIIRAVEVLAQEIAAGVRSGETAAWTHAEKEFNRTIDALRDEEQAARTGPMGEHYAALVDVAGGNLGGLLTQVGEYLKAGAASLQHAKLEDGVFADLGQSLMDSAASFENRVRIQK
jgi:hypothetical protein